MVVYDMNIKINPETEEIFCDAKIKLSNNTNCLDLQLYKGFEIEQVYNDGSLIDFEEVNKGLQFKPESKTIILKNKNNLRNIRMVYKGKLSGEICNYNNKLHEDFFLLTDYAPWYPTIKGETVNILSIVRGVSEYNILNGDYDIDTDSWRVKGSALVGVKNNFIEKVSFNGFEFSVIYYNSDEENDVLKSAEIVKDCLDFYTSKLFNDKINNMSLFYFKPKVPINNGWSFIRDNIIVSPEQFSNEISMARLMAHELAHIWSSGARLNWEDWLNECFAEYASCLFLEYRYGIDVYNRVISYHIKYNKEYFADQAIRPKNGTARPDSVHVKGVIVLDKL